MSTLYIANTSSRHNEFVFRLPGVEQIRRVVIGAGKQEPVLKNVNRDEVDYVIKQHQKYGLVPASEGHKICKFSGMVYSIDKPVPKNAMEVVIEKNNEILAQQGHEQRKIAAVAINEQFAQVAPEMKSSEIEIVEIETEDNLKKKNKMKEKIKVAEKE